MANNFRRILQSKHFNGDETGFLLTGASNTLKFKGKECMVKNYKKEHIHVFVCVNMVGAGK